MNELSLPSSEIINVGIIGASYGVTNLLPVLDSIPDYRVISIATNSKINSNLKLMPNLRENITLVSVKELIQNKNISLVVVASPPSTHEEFVISALRAKKNIYCEKPAGLSSDSTRRIFQVANQTELISTVGLQFRYDPMINWLKTQIMKGKVGEINRVEVQWSTSGNSNTPSKSWRNHLDLGGGVLRDFGIHVFDYLLFLDIFKLSYNFSTTSSFYNFKNNNLAHNIQNIDFSFWLNSTEFRFVISRTSVKSSGHYIRIIGSKAEVWVKHSPPFRIQDFTFGLAEKSKVPRDTANVLSPVPILTDLSVQNLDVRGLSSRKLFIDLAHAIAGNTPNNLPTLEQAIFSHKIVDRVQEILF
jgi:predicted dehydrogenase